VIVFGGHGGCISLEIGRIADGGASACAMIGARRAGKEIWRWFGRLEMTQMMNGIEQRVMSDGC